MTAVGLPRSFGYVGAALLSASLVAFGQSLVVGRYRKQAGIKYPQLYADQVQVAASKDAHLFNCAQRAHQNTLENIPIIYTVTLLTSLKFPIFAASMCGLWSISRISYTRGYLTGEPKNRVSMLYRFGGLGSIGLLVASLYVVGDLIAAGM